MSSKKKIKNKIVQNPEVFKESGNKAFSEKNFESAIEFYSKAIQIDPSNAIYYSNRAQALFEIDKFQESLTDCDQALQLNPQYIKVYCRKACVLMELGQLHEALKIIEEGIQIDKNNQSLIQLQYKIQYQIQSDNILPEDHPEIVKMTNLVNWLIQGKAEFSKLKLKYYSQNERGVHSKCKISVNEQIIFIPKSHLITLEMAKEISICQKIIQNQIELLSPKHSFLAIFILEEKDNPNSFWKPYIDILPTNFDNIPIFFSSQDLAWLDGSPFLEYAKEKVADLKLDYDSIYNTCIEFQKYSFEQYCWARMSISSRIFGIEIDNNKEVVCVPFGDMLNHRLPKQTQWNYNQEKGGFTIEALENIEIGEPVHQSYGYKCNSRYLLNYGFTDINNNYNEVAIKVSYNLHDQLKTEKEKYIQGNAQDKIFKIMQNLDSDNVVEFIAYLRFVELSDQTKLQYLYNLYQANTPENLRDGYKPQKTPPVSIQNEQDMLNKIKSLCNEQLNKYPTKLEEDISLLNQNNLTNNQRNCVILRLGEKQILNFFVQMVDRVLPLLSQSLKNEFQNYQEYINKSIIYLLVKANQL